MLKQGHYIAIGCVGFLAMIGLGYAYAGLPPSGGTLLLNLVGALLSIIGGCIMLVRQRDSDRRGLWELVQTWAWVVCIFAGAYFVLHRLSPSLFRIDQEVADTAKSRAIDARADSFADAWKDLQLVDRAITSKEPDRSFRDSDGLEWRASVRRIPDRPNVSRPSMVELTVEADAEHRESWEIIGEFDESLDTHLFKARAIELVELRENSSLSSAPTGFSVIDFYYFALMIPGADVITPTATFTRLLVVVQFFVFVALGYRNMSGRGDTAG